MKVMKRKRRVMQKKMGSIFSARKGKKDIYEYIEITEDEKAKYGGSSCLTLNRILAAENCRVIRDYKIKPSTLIDA